MIITLLSSWTSVAVERDAECRFGASHDASRTYGCGELMIGENRCYAPESTVTLRKRRVRIRAVYALFLIGFATLVIEWVV